MNYLIKTKKGTIMVSEEECIANALEQERQGIEPSYSGYGLPCGWLIWSTWESGCGVVYRRVSDGKMIVLTGWQGDFIYK